MMNKNIKLLKMFSLIVFFLMIIFLILTVHYKIMYKEAIKQGAEGIMLGLELTTACTSLGNFTQEEIKDKWFEMFIEPKFKEGAS